MKHLKSINEAISHTPIPESVYRMILKCLEENPFEVSMELDGQSLPTIKQDKNTAKLYPNLMKALNRPEIVAALCQDYANSFKFPINIEFTLYTSGQVMIDFDDRSNTSNEYYVYVDTKFQTKDISMLDSILQEKGYTLFTYPKKKGTVDRVKYKSFEDGIDDDFGYVVAARKKVSNIAELGIEIDFLKMFSKNPRVAASKKLSAVTNQTGLLD